ncbi:MAG: MFS transporter [Candidatus Omnitrophica bacterium]|nr:MFS transporter [Candidatus Omnitrophota bacterium]
MLSAILFLYHSLRQSARNSFNHQKLGKRHVSSYNQLSMENNQQQHPHFAEALKVPDIRLFIGSVGFFSLASRALAVVIGFQIYRLTHSALALGWLGLIEAIPTLSLVLIGGYVADHFNRRRILLITRAASFLCACALAWLSLENNAHSLIGLYGVIFLTGIARGFADPANTAFEAQVVPKHLTVNAASWISSTFISCSVIGPAGIGFIFEALGATGSYAVIAAGFLLSLIFTFFITPRPQPVPETKEPLLQSIGTGWRFVWKNQPLLSAMSLDLLAVLFGGMIALLPIYADDILHVGARGLGLMNAAPSLGAVIITLLATRRPPIARAGRNLLLTVAGFGASTILFAFSRNFWLSMGLLFLTGVFDGISMVIRRSMVRLLSPDHLRGRIAAANWLFICSSNELGAWESGMVAAWLGTIPCVAVGGVLTLAVAAVVTLAAPQLRRLRFDTRTLEQK